MLKKLLGAFLLIIIIAIGYLGYLGIIPGISKVFGSDKPRDLGIKYTIENYQTADTKAQVKIETIETATTVKEGLVWTGKKAVANSFSAEELTATINTHAPNWKYFPVTDAQVKINADGSAAFSGLLHFDRLAGYSEAMGANYASIQLVMDKFKIVPSVLPIYVDGAATVTNGVVNFAVNKAEFGRIGVPKTLIEKSQGGINGFFTQQINAVPGFYIESLDFKNGQMNFKGTMPEKVVTAKN